MNEIAELAARALRSDGLRGNHNLLVRRTPRLHANPKRTPAPLQPTPLVRGLHGGANGTYVGQMGVISGALDCNVLLPGAAAPIWLRVFIFSVSCEATGPPPWVRNTVSHARAVLLFG